MVIINGNIVNEIKNNLRVQKNGSIYCKKCQKKFDNETLFYDHHCEPTKILCTICNKQINFYSYQQHKDRHENLRKYKCELCDAEFNQSAHLIIHKHHIHNVNKSFQCSLCNKFFKTRWSYRNHLVSIHENNKFSCPYCNKSFSLKGNMETHISAYHNKIRYPCWICVKSFNEIQYDVNTTCPLFVSVKYETSESGDNKKRKTNNDESKNCEINNNEINDDESKKYEINDNLNNKEIGYNTSFNTEEIIIPDENLKRKKSKHARYIFVNEYQLNNHINLFHPTIHTIDTILEFYTTHNRWPSSNIMGISNQEKNLARILYKIILMKNLDSFNQCTKSVASIIEDSKTMLEPLIKNTEEVIETLKTFRTELNI